MMQSKAALTSILALATILCGCSGNLKSGVDEAAGSQVFEACKAQVQVDAVRYEEAKKRAQAHFDAGNKKDGCQFRRGALEAVNTSIESFESGKCQDIHKVANDYISWKLKAFQQRLDNERVAAQDALKRDCGRA